MKSVLVFHSNLFFHAELIYIIFIMPYSIFNFNNIGIIF